MPENSPPFEAFATQELGAQVLEMSPEDPKTGLFHTSLTSALALSAWTAKARDAAGVSFALEAGFVDLMSPNALADRWQGKQIIATHSALFVAINEFALFCFTQAGFFSDVGDPSKELSPAPWNDQVPGLWLLEHTSSGGHVGEEHGKRLIPKDSERYVMAIYLAQLMARFTWLHELAHGFNGHVALCKETGIAPRLYELSDPRHLVSVVKTYETAATQRLFEFDADQSAFWASLNIQKHGLENIEGIAMLDIGLRLRLTLFGAYAMIWLIEQFQAYLDSRDGDTHPSPTLRLQNLFRTLESNLDRLGDDLIPLNADVLQQFSAVQAAIPSLFGEADLVARMRNTALMEQLISLDPRFDDLKARLKVYEFSQR